MPHHASLYLMCSRGWGLRKFAGNGQKYRKLKNMTSRKESSVWKKTDKLPGFQENNSLWDERPYIRFQNHRRVIGWAEIGDMHMSEQKWADEFCIWNICLISSTRSCKSSTNHDRLRNMAPCTLGKGNVILWPFGNMLWVDPIVVWASFSAQELHLAEWLVDPRFACPTCHACEVGLFYCCLWDDDNVSSASLCFRHRPHMTLGFDACTQQWQAFISFLSGFAHFGALGDLDRQKVTFVCVVVLSDHLLAVGEFSSCIIHHTAWEQSQEGVASAFVLESRLVPMWVCSCTPGVPVGVLCLSEELLNCANHSLHLAIGLAVSRASGSRTCMLQQTSGTQCHQMACCLRSFPQECHILQICTSAVLRQLTRFCQGAAWLLEI